jgi:hypothetical protein
MKRSKEMSAGFEWAGRKLCVPVKLLSTASVDATADPSPGAGFPCRRMELGAITVDTTDKEFSGQKGIWIQWR